jgi:hypothetical protein
MLISGAARSCDPLWTQTRVDAQKETYSSAPTNTAPALAQSFNPEIGTGNSVQFSYGQTAQTTQLAARQNGLNAFALVPRASSASESSDRSTTGRGNISH